MDNATALQLVASFGSLVSILAIGSKLIRHASRVELKVNMMWEWWKREHGIGGDE